MIDPTSSETTGYHLFLEPRGRLGTELRAIIDGLSGTYGTPSFAPHVTLLARIQEAEESVLVAKAETLAKVLPRQTLTLGELAMEEAYYRALYSRIEERDSVQAMYRQACVAFGISESPEYLPHLSLLYGNHDRALKEEIKNRLVLPQDRSFVADTLYVYRTKGEVGNWHAIAEFPIGG